MIQKLSVLKSISLLLVIIFVSAISCTKKNVATPDPGRAAPDPGRKSTNTIMHDDIKRSYHLYVPALYDSRKPEWIIGIVSKDMNAGEVIWNFFERFSMQD